MKLIKFNADKAVVIHLTGGLGNQLFQVSKALSQFPNRRILLEHRIGRPRLNSKGLPEITSFYLPDRVAILKTGRPLKITVKAVSYCLRLNLNTNRRFRSLIVGWLASTITGILVSVYFRKFVVLRIGQGIGDSFLQESRFTIYQVGYFQSFQSATGFSSISDSDPLNIRDFGTQLQTLRQQAKERQILVVHIRLTDYLQENNFGTPDPEYFVHGIQKVLQQYPSMNIWAFSDDVGQAIKFFPKKYAKITTWINEVDGSTAATLEAMRLGSAYVIANSTFSWWGAVLSRNPRPMVIYPAGWFRFIPEPDKLIPDDWIGLQAWPEKFSKR